MRTTSLARSIAVAVTLAASAAPILHSHQRAGGPAQAGTAFVLGTVVDADTAKPVSAAIVTLGAPPPAQASSGELVEIGVPPAVTGRRILTGTDGRFLFRELPKGRYALSVSAPGYAPANFGQGRPAGPGQTIDLEDGQKLGGVTIRAWRFGAISGTVTDDRGEPAVGVSIRCLRRVIAGGQPRFAVEGTTATSDDRGMYRSSGLLPGDYICGTNSLQTTVPVAAAEANNAASATGNPNSSEAYRNMQASGARVETTGTRVGDVFVRYGSVGARGFTAPPPGADGRVMTYPVQYVGGASTPSQASLMPLKSGEERNGADLQLKLAPTAHVSGAVTGPNGPAAFLGMTLVPVGGNDLVSEGTAEAARTISDAAGRFTFLSIPAGQYLLKIRMYPRAPVAAGPATTAIEATPAASADPPFSGAPGAGLMGRGATPPPPPPTDPSLWATMAVTVAETNVSNVAVTLRQGHAVSGRVEFVGSRAQPTADQVQRMAIRMQSAEGRTSSPIAAEGRAAADMTFRTASYIGGRYVASVVAATIPPGWTLRSVTSGGKDISVDPVDLTDGDVTGVVVTFTDQSTELSGTVMNTRNAPEASADVVVFPADSEVWKTTGVVARRWRNDRVTRAGTFSIAGLPPGEYYVAAVSSDAPQDRRDPKFLETLVRTATRVALGDGEKKSIDVRTSR